MGFYRLREDWLALLAVVDFAEILLESERTGWGLQCDRVKPIMLMVMGGVMMGREEWCWCWCRAYVVVFTVPIPPSTASNG